MRLSYLWIAMLALPFIACKKDKQVADTPYTNTISEDDYIPCTPGHWNSLGTDGAEFGNIQFVYNDKCYAPENNATVAGNNRVHVFDGTSWTVKNSTVPVRTDQPIIVFSIGNKGYAADRSAAEGEPVKFYQYNITTNTWTRKADFPGLGRYGVACFSVGGKGYAVGGYRTGEHLEYPYSNKTWEYDPLLNTWTERKSLVIGRAQSVGFSIGNKGYITNGRLPANGGYYSSTMEYDPATDEWTRKADFPGTGRSKSESFVIGDYAYVGGGWNMSELKDFYKYSPATDKWTQVDDIPIPNGDTYLYRPFSINSRGYISYGISGTGTHTFLKYTPTICGYVFEPTQNTNN